MRDYMEGLALSIAALVVILTAESDAAVIVGVMCACAAMICITISRTAKGE